MADLVRQRPVTNPYFTLPTQLETAEQERIDGKIAEVHRERRGTLREVVLADNPDAQIADRTRGLYRLSVSDHKGQLRWLSGGILPIWHLQSPKPVVFRFAAAIRSRPDLASTPPGTQITTQLMLAGTSSQSGVHPYPGDIDYAEEVNIQAPGIAEAGEAMAAIVVEAVNRVSDSPNLEFDVLHVMVPPARRLPDADYEWPRARIGDPSQRQELARQFADIDGGRINTDWRLLIPGGRYIVIGKIYGVHATHSFTSEVLFTTQPLGTAYQQVYFGANPPTSTEKRTLGDFASHMRNQALREVRKGHYLKAAKRAFNYLRSISDLEAMAAVSPVFARPEARVNQHVKVLEAVAVALDPEIGTRILTVADARGQLLEAATVISENLPVIPGTIRGRPQGIAEELHAVARAIRGRTADSTSILEPDMDLANRMQNLLDVEIKPMIRMSLERPVQQIIDTYVQ